MALVLTNGQGEEGSTSVIIRSARPRAETAGVKKAALIPQHDSIDTLSKHYADLRGLGSGAFGSVRLVEDKRFGQKRVCKVVSTRAMAPLVLEAMRKEIRLLRSLDHPSIVRLYESAEDSQAEQLTLILEYINGGDCDELLKKARASQNPLEESLVARLLYQLLVALSFCHNRGVAHRDVKPSNMMLIYPEGGGEPDCKLIDFGLAERSTQSMKDFVGSPKYMAPELHRQSPYSFKADVWSAGVAALQLLSGSVPFVPPWATDIGGYEDFEVLEERLVGSRMWAIRSEEAQLFIESLLEAEVNERPTAADALHFPWLQMHKPPARKFRKDIARSLVGYTAAPSVVRCCLLSIAARVGAENAEAIGHAFLGADTDGDGLISHEDLDLALQDMDGFKWWCDSASKVNVARVLETADLAHRGGVGFTEFMAACLYGEYRSLEDLAEKAFYALDDDRDELITVEQIQGMFRQRDKPFLSRLPRQRPFGRAEWVARVLDYASDGSMEVISSPDMDDDSDDSSARAGFLDLSACYCGKNR